MPSLWFKYEDPSVGPHEVQYAVGESVEAITAANSGNGWSVFEPDEGDAADLRPSTAPNPSPGKPVDSEASGSASPDLHIEE